MTTPVCRNRIGWLLSCISLLYNSFVIAQDNRNPGSLPQPAFIDNYLDAVPTFIIIGTAKGGTTDLYEQLADVAVNADPARPEPPILRGPRKEVDFFGFWEEDPVKISPRFREYLVRLGHPCANVTDDDLRPCFNTSGSKYYTLDATPDYVHKPTVPIQLGVISPDTKVIVLLRDPVQRLEMYYRHMTLEGLWKDTSLDGLSDAFFTYLRGRPELLKLLRGLVNETNTGRIASGWLELAAEGFLDQSEIQIFAGGLYRYALAAWRSYYFQPRRAMVIDSHEYYRNRVGVMEKVIYFLYGRNMTAAERACAEKQSFWRKADDALLHAGTKWILSGAKRFRVHSFYRRHVMWGMANMLSEMQREGVWIVGFEDAPWRHQGSNRTAAPNLP